VRRRVPVQEARRTRSSGPGSGACDRRLVPQFDGAPDYPTSNGFPLLFPNADLTIHLSSSFPTLSPSVPDVTRAPSPTEDGRRLSLSYQVKGRRSLLRGNVDGSSVGPSQRCARRRHAAFGFVCPPPPPPPPRKLQNQPTTRAFPAPTCSSSFGRTIRRPGPAQRRSTMLGASQSPLAAAEASRTDSLPAAERTFPRVG